MKERLLEFMKSEGVTQNAFEDLCGLSRGTITNLNKGIRSDKLAQIAVAYPSLNLRWLLLGEGEMMLRTFNARECPVSDDGKASLEVSVIKTAGAVIISDAASLESMVEKVVAKVLGGK